MAAAFLCLTLGAMALVALGWSGLVGKLPPNHFAGIRTPFTLSNSDHWYATHRAAAPLLIFGGVAVMMAALAFLPFAFVDRLPGALAAAVALALTGVLLVTALASWLYGTHVARTGSQ